LSKYTIKAQIYKSSTKYLRHLNAKSETGYELLDLGQGKQLLSGHQALLFMRLRHGRTDNGHGYVNGPWFCGHVEKSTPATPWVSEKCFFQKKLTQEGIQRIILANVE
jgi:hypothetical protein